MFYSSRSIKINFFCRKLYEHIFLALEKDKPILSKLYIIHHFGVEKEKEISKYTFNELFVRVIEEIECKSENQITQMIVEVSLNKRIQYVKKIIGLEQQKNIRSNISFRVKPDVMEKVKKIKENLGFDTLSEVCELAIMYYVTLVDETAYKLMTITLESEFPSI